MKILILNGKNSRTKKNLRIILINSEMVFDLKKKRKDQNLGKETLNPMTPCPASGTHNGTLSL